jgi:serine/threonine-protein kinase RsbW
MSAHPQRAGKVNSETNGEHNPVTSPPAMNGSYHPLDRFPADIIIPSEVSESHRVQQMMIEQLKASAFCEREIFAIKLAVEEAMVNAMKHGNQLDRSKKVRVSFHIAEDTFYVRIGDEGAGFDPEDVPDPTQEENLERPCGRGLLLMRYYMNEVQFFDRGTTVVMWKRRNGTH